MHKALSTIERFFNVRNYIPAHHQELIFLKHSTFFNQVGRKALTRVRIPAGAFIFVCDDFKISNPQILKTVSFLYYNE